MNLTISNIKTSVYQMTHHREDEKARHWLEKEACNTQNH